MSQQTVTTKVEEEDDKPLTGSWRGKIQKNKGFILLVEEILQQIPTQGKEADARIRARVVENCETIWKLGAADKCGSQNGNSNGNGEPKKLRNEAILNANSEPVEMIEVNKVPQPMVTTVKPASINSAPEAQKETKTKSKKTKSKSCDC